jgi:hypothetical protein
MSLPELAALVVVVVLANRMYELSLNNLPKSLSSSFEDLPQQ